METEMISHAFWKRLKDWVESRRHEAWMREQRHDRKCPACQTWFGGSGTWRLNVLASNDPMADVIRCAQCSTITVWDCRGMMPVPCMDATLRSLALSPQPGDS